MECDQARERVSLQLDGELSSHEVQLLERHLTQCPDCEGFASAVRASTALLRGAPLERSQVVFTPWRRSVAVRWSGRAAAVVASAAAAVLVAASAGWHAPSTVGRTAAAGSSLAGRALNPPGDANLGVQRPVGTQVFVKRMSDSEPRRGLFGI